MTDDEFLKLASELASLDHGTPVSYLYWALRDTLDHPGTVRPLLHLPRVILFGARQKGEGVLSLLQKRNFADVLCFFDLDPQRWGTLLNGVAVRQPARAEADRADAVIISTNGSPAMKEALSVLGLNDMKLCADPAAFLARFRPDLFTGLRDPQRVLSQLESPFLRPSATDV